jgi:hypothetical protein
MNGSRSCASVTSRSWSAKPDTKKYWHVRLQFPNCVGHFDAAGDRHPGVREDYRGSAVAGRCCSIVMAVRTLNAASIA